MHIDLYIALAGLVVGFTVGLTGMGGGALMTPILVLLFRVQPLAAVSSDLVASFVMKPFGGAVHIRRGTVNWTLVRWLVVGSVPSALLGVGLIRILGHGKHLQDVVQGAMGAALLLAAATIAVKAVIGLRHRSHEGRSAASSTPITVRPLPTLAIGAFGGLLVGMTSVGSGSLIIVLLLFLYPSLRASQLVGTDLVQAIPLVGAAAFGHVLIGDFRLALTLSLLVGSIPGVYLGARISAHSASRLVRPAIAFVLLASGLKLIQVGNIELGAILLGVLVVGPPLWIWLRATDGFPLRPLPQKVHY